VRRVYELDHIPIKEIPFGKWKHSEGKQRQ
jgi:hypothetical protein